MKETTSLERGYRRVLACYPKTFRQESGQEILAVLLASARDGQRRIGLAESAALVRGALRMRLRPAVRPPRAVRSAVRLMYLGAALEVAAVITILVTAGQVRAAVAWQPGLTVAQWHAVGGALTGREVGGGVAALAWLFLAWALGHQRDVARISGAALFCLMTLVMLVSLGQHDQLYAPADMIAGGALWLVALATTVLIFTRRSNAYYRQGIRRPARATG